MSIYCEAISELVIMGDLNTLCKNYGSYPISQISERMEKDRSAVMTVQDCYSVGFLVEEQWIVLHPVS